MNIISVKIALILLFLSPYNQKDVTPIVTLESEELKEGSIISLFDKQGWYYHPGDDPSLAVDSTLSGAWSPVSLAMLPGQVPGDWDGIGWFAGMIRIDSSLYNKEVALWGRIYGGMEVYVNGEWVGSVGRVGTDYKTEETIGWFEPISFTFSDSDLHFISIRYSNHNYQKAWDNAPIGPILRFGLTETSFNQYHSLINETRNNRQVSFLMMGMLLAFAFLHFTLFFYYPAEKANLAYSLLLLSYFLLSYATVSYGLTLNPELFLRSLYIEGVAVTLVGIINIYFVFIVTRRKINWIPVSFSIAGIAILYFVVSNPVQTRSFLILFSYLSTITAIVLFSYDRFIKKQKDLNVIILAYIIYFAMIIPRTLLLAIDVNILWAEYQFITQLGVIFIPAGYSIYLAKNIASTNRQLKNKLEENEILASEKQRMIESKKEELEKEVLARTSDLNESYELLKDSMEKLTAAQDQLVQQEKLASLGQLTAGIAHEIKNPLNFVNNFSEVSIEMIDEARDELTKVETQLIASLQDDGKERNMSPLEGGKVPIYRNQGDGTEPDYNSNINLILEILDDIEANLRKIHEHGSRADGIVKSMLMHSRGGTGKMEQTKLNALVKEYVNLAFHGMRAGKEAINVDIQMDLDESIGEIPMIAEDFSRVILNLCNNAFDAMRDKTIQNLKFKIQNYTPKLSIRTKSENDRITIEIEDNGPGIADDIKDKILQPFFTTKKGTQGTGLGLSITYDIVKAHGGTIDINSVEGKTIFSIVLTQKK